jgi:predicted methyltransferase
MARVGKPGARDACRHPHESLIFWGLKPGMTVVEIDPGAKGWWTEILDALGDAFANLRISSLR